jgi:hypothetical protein
MEVFMKYQIGDKVQIISDFVNEYPQYIGKIAIIDRIDESYEFPYELTILNDNGDAIDHELCWEEEGLQLTSESIAQRAEVNLQSFLKLDAKVQKAAEYAGITKQQSYKFMDGFNL